MSVVDPYIETYEEYPWVKNPLALVWPPLNMFKLSPFEPGMSASERLNAHARMTILIGAGVFVLTARRNENASVIVLWVVLFLLNQGVSFMLSEDGKREAHVVDIITQRAQHHVQSSPSPAAFTHASPPPHQQQSLWTPSPANTSERMLGEKWANTQAMYRFRGGGNASNAFLY